MPASVLTAAIALGACGFGLLCFGLAAVVFSGSTLAAITGVLGVAELIALGRLLEHRQAARVVALSLALLQALFGVIFLVLGGGLGLLMIPMAGLIVIPLASDGAEQYFEPQA